MVREVAPTQWEWEIVRDNSPLDIRQREGLFKSEAAAMAAGGPRTPIGTRPIGKAKSRRMNLPHAPTFMAERSQWWKAVANRQLW